MLFQIIKAGSIIGLSYGENRLLIGGTQQLHFF